MADSDREVGGIAYYFDLAVEQYSDVSLFFYLDKCPYSQVKGVCAGVKNGHFIVRVPLSALENTQIVWGSDVSGYFTVRDAQMVHCHFTTRLARLYNAPPDAMFLVCPLPKSMDHNQRRFSRRVTIGPEAAEGIGVWHSVLEGGDANSLPKARWLALESRHCELGEMSANGMRLDFPAKSPILARLGLNDPILLKGDFAPKNKPAPIFVLGNVVRIMPRPDSEEEITCVGCHFRAWRKVDPKAGQTWFRADSQEGIGVIAQWISRNFRNVNI